MSLMQDPGAVLVFALERRRFAVRARYVQEIVRAVAISALPAAPPVMEGIVNYRGRVVPVLDIRARFGLPPEPLRPEQHFIVAEAGPRLVALRVDRAVELLDVPEGALEAASGAAPGARFTEGFVLLPDGLVVIHDLERFLSLDEGEQVDAAIAGLGGPVMQGAGG
jgi:purine-binding chemotaxis protein CheW